MDDYVLSNYVVMHVSMHELSSCLSLCVRARKGGVLAHASEPPDSPHFTQVSSIMSLCAFSNFTNCEACLISGPSPQADHDISKTHSHVPDLPIIPSNSRQTQTNTPFWTAERQQTAQPRTRAPSHKSDEVASRSFLNLKSSNFSHEKDIYYNFLKICIL